VRGSSRCGYDTHLTVDFGGDVKADEVQDHCHESGHTRKAVYLRKSADQPHRSGAKLNVITDPY